MNRVLGGAVLVIAGIAAFIEAHSHRPESIFHCRTVSGEAEGLCIGHSGHYVRVGLSHTAYDLLRIGAWALVIVGVLVVVMGLIRYWRTQGVPAR